jgi:hypothetical protein
MVDWGRIGLGVATGGLSEAWRPSNYNIIPGVGPTISRVGGSLSGQTSADAAKSASDQQRQNAGTAAQIAWDQRKNTDDVTRNALGFFQPANSAYQNMYGQNGSLTTPGYGEQAYANYGSMLSQPTNSQGWYNGAASQLSEPSAAEQFFNPSAYQKTTNAENFLNNYGSQYTSNPMGRSYQGLMGQLSGGPMSQAYGGIMSGLQDTANTQSLYQSTGMQYNTDAMSSALSGLMGQLDPNTTSKLSKNFDSINGSLTDETNQEMMFNDINQKLQGSDQFTQFGMHDLTPRSNQINALIGQEDPAQGKTQLEYNNIRPTFADPGATANEYNLLRSNLADPGIYEKFVTGALTGNDPYFDRLSSEGSSKIDAEMNARGGYNSGAALKALGNYQGDLRANQYSQLASMAQGAQGMQLSRAGQLQGLAGQLQGERMGQAQGLMGLAGQTESELQQRLKAQDVMGQENYQNLFNLRGATGQEQRDIAGGMVNQNASLDAARLGRIGAQIQLGSATDAATLARTMGQGDLANMASTQRLNYMGQRANLANMADSQNLGRLTEQGNLTNMYDTSQMNRTMGQANIANMASSQNLNYLNSLGNASMGADTSYLNLLQGGQNAANSASGAQLARLMGGGQLANSADNNNRANLTTMFNSANQAQSLAEQRQQSAFANAMGLGGAQAGITMAGGNQASSEYDKWMENSLGYKSNASQVDLAAANAQQAFYTNLLSMGLGAGGLGGARPQAQTIQSTQPDLGASFNPNQQYMPQSYNPYSFSQTPFQKNPFGQNPFELPTMTAPTW